MKSFITSAEKLFKMNTEVQGTDNFDENKRKLIIPKYQREYRWPSEMVTTLLKDIKDKKKFLGIVILDQMNDSYEVVDGQQRLTTWFLILAAIYNFYENDQFEQRSLDNLIVRNDNLVLQNQSVGTYLVKNGNRYELSIEENSDIYYQKEAFENSWSIINTFISETLQEHEEVRKFKGKLFSCDFLILINSSPADDQSVEQVFLDINEKSEILNPADIFKGHCFELFDKEFHEELKDKWSKIKEVSKKFEKNFKYKNTSWFLYMYFLNEGRINENLSIPNTGRHYLQGKQMGEVNSILDSIISYGKEVSDFYSKCKSIDYSFETVCRASYEHRNTSDIPLMKKMSILLLEKNLSNAQFQKIPFMYFIAMREKYVNEITHEQTRRIVTNLYTYATLFELSTMRKSKDIISHSVRDFFTSDEQLQELVRRTTNIRNTQIDSFVMIADGNKLEKLADIYSLMDYYDVARGGISNYYSLDRHYNLEHLVVNDNDTVQWKVGTEQITLCLDVDESKKRKKKTINYILINDSLNGDLQSFDIITKMEKIREWHSARNLELPKHVTVVFNSICALDEYQALAAAKEQDSLDENEIAPLYNAFLDKYFENANELTILDTLTNSFKRAFQQNN